MIGGDKDNNNTNVIVIIIVVVMVVKRLCFGWMGWIARPSQAARVYLARGYLHPFLVCDVKRDVICRCSVGIGTGLDPVTF